MPESPIRVSGRPPLGQAQAHDLRQPAGDQRRPGVVAEAPAFGDAATDGEHILDRAAQLAKCVVILDDLKQRIVPETGGAGRR